MQNRLIKLSIVKVIFILEIWVELMKKGTCILLEEPKNSSLLLVAKTFLPFL